MFYMVSILYTVAVAYGFFPTKLCGVLVFRSVPRVDLLLLPHFHTFVTSNFVTHTTLSHTNCHTQLCHTQSFTHTHNFVTHSLVTHTHNFVTHSFVTHTQLCHTTLSHTTWHTHTLTTFAWQAWHLVTSTFVSRGRCGTWWHPPSFCVAGVALMGLGWVWWRAWGPLVAIDAHFCVAGVALGDTWQVWHLVTSTFVLRGRRGTYGTGLGLVTRLEPLGHDWRRGTSAWQVWHLVTSTFVSRGRCGTWWHPRSFCVAGVALHLWDWAGSGDVLGAPWSRLTLRHFCVAGVALGDIHLHFAWQAWHLVTSTFVLRGRPCACWHTHTHNFVTHYLSHTTFTFTHISLSHTHNFVTHHLSHTTLSHTTLSHTIFVKHTFVTPTSLSHTTLSHTIFHTHTTLSHIALSHTIFVTHNFVTHHLSHTSLSHTHATLSHTHTQLCHTHTHTIFHTHNFVTHTSWLHTIFHTHLCHIPSFMHNVVTHYLPHTPLSHTIFHTHLCYTPSFKHIFVTHHLSRTSWLHTMFATHPLPRTRTQLFHTHHCHTPSFTHNLFTYNVVIHRSSTTSLVYPAFPVPLQLCVLILGRSWLLGFSGPLISLFSELSSCSCSLYQTVETAVYRFGLWVPMNPPHWFKLVDKPIRS